MCCHLLKPLPHALRAWASGLFSSPFSPCRQHVRRHSVLERSGPSCQKNEWNKISGHVWERPHLLTLHWKHVAEPGIKLESLSGTAQNLNCITASSIRTTSSVVVTELDGRKQNSARKQGVHPVAGIESARHLWPRGTRVRWHCWSGIRAIINGGGGAWEPHKKESFTLPHHTNTNPVNAFGG